MAQDARTIILAINPNAKFLTPSPNPGNGKGVASWMDGYLAAGGGQYADIIAFHGYCGTTPEAVVPIITGLQSTLAKYGLSAKPIWDTEASWGAKADFSDDDERAAFVSRMYLLHWANGVPRFFWFGWDYDNSGTLWQDVATGTCTIAGSGGFLCPSGQAYGLISDWLMGATMTTPCAASGTVWTCGITRSNGYQAQIVWDAGQSCSNGSCTTSHFQVPAIYTKGANLEGKFKNVGSSIAISVRPIILETSVLP